jgi:hypothetical protein
MDRHYAIPSKQKYPIETADHIKTASDYFDTNFRRMDTNDRAEYASSVRARANELGVKLASSNIINYSNRGSYSPEFEQNMLLRKIACATQNVIFNKDGKEIKASEFIEKLADAHQVMKPEYMVYLVHEFDKAAGLVSSYDNSIKDAYFTVFGCNSDPLYLEKIAALKNPHWLTDTEVKTFAEKPGAKDAVMVYFGENFAQDFIAQPVDTYKNLKNNSDREAFHHMVKGTKSETVIA